MGDNNFNAQAKAKTCAHRGGQIFFENLTASMRGNMRSTPSLQFLRWLGDARRLLKPVTLPDWEFPDAYQGKVFEEQGICIVIS
jgi:hypothetical protein